jgi:hypothetical protein
MQKTIKSKRMEMKDMIAGMRRGGMNNIEIFNALTHDEIGRPNRSERQAISISEMVAGKPDKAVMRV